MPKIALYGAGALGLIASEIYTTKRNVDVVGFIDDHKKGFVSVLPIIGKWKDIDIIMKQRGIDSILVCLGDGFSSIRWKAFQFLEKNKYTSDPLLHNRAVISNKAIIGKGSIIMALTVIGPRSRIGKNTVIYSSCNLEHDDVVGKNVFISPGAKICGYVNIGDHSFIGANATIIPDITVGCNVTVGAGSTVIEDIPDNTIVVGNPARKIGIKKLAAYY